MCSNGLSCVRFGRHGDAADDSMQVLIKSHPEMKVRNVAYGSFRIVQVLETSRQKLEVDVCRRKRTSSKEDVSKGTSIRPVPYNRNTCQWPNHISARRESNRISVAKIFPESQIKVSKRVTCKGMLGNNLRILLVCREPVTPHSHRETLTERC